MIRMHSGKSIVAVGSTLLLALAVACGGTSRVAAPGAPSGLTASAGNGQVTLSWTASAGASGYNVYYGTSAGVTKANGTKVANITSTSTTVTGLTNDTAYFFVVTAFTSGGESSESNEASAQPAPTGNFTQSQLEGTWRFVALSAGASPGWSRGVLSVDSAGGVTFSSYTDSAGASTAPTTLFPRLLIDASGQVRDAANLGDAVFKGNMGSVDPKKVVGTASSGGTQLLAVLLKHDPSVTFTPATSATSPGDIGGFGGGAGGSRRFVYNQISAGASPQEWEFAQGQIGANNPTGGVQYTFGNPATPYTLFFSASNSTPTRPGDKASILSLGTDGSVTESLNTNTGTSAPQAPPPSFVMGSNAGFMSDDKALIVSTTTDASTGRSVLRIYQLINLGFNSGTGQDTAGGQPLAFAVADLGGTYAFRELALASSPVTASGTMTIDGTSGAATFTSYTDTAGGAAPSGFTLAFDQANQPAGKQNGILSSADAPTVNGKLGDFKDMLVLTRTDSAGNSRLTIALK